MTQREQPIVKHDADRTMRRRRKGLPVRRQMHQAQGSVYAFRSEVGRCPRSTVELIHPPRSRTRFLRDMPRDGWGRELQIHCPGVDDPDGVDVLSAGPSGDFLNDDNLR